MQGLAVGKVVTEGDSPVTVFGVFTEIGIINQLATRLFESFLPAGMSLAQFSVLDHIGRLDGDWTPARLANVFQVPRPTMTHTLQRLAAAKLVNFVANPRDARGKIVRLTAKGRAQRDAARDAATPLLEAIGAAMPAGLFAALLPPLGALRAFLDAAGD